MFQIDHLRKSYQDYYFNPTIDKSLKGIVLKYQCNTLHWL